MYVYLCLIHKSIFFCPPRTIFTSSEAVSQLLGWWFRDCENEEQPSSQRRSCQWDRRTKIKWRPLNQERKNEWSLWRTVLIGRRRWWLSIDRWIWSPGDHWVFNSQWELLKCRGDQLDYHVQENRKEHLWTSPSGPFCGEGGRENGQWLKRNMGPGRILKDGLL